MTKDEVAATVAMVNMDTFGPGADGDLGYPLGQMVEGSARVGSRAAERTADGRECGAGGLDRFGTVLPSARYPALRSTR